MPFNARDTKIPKLPLFLKLRRHNISSLRQVARIDVLRAAFVNVGHGVPTICASPGNLTPHCDVGHIGRLKVMIWF
jgi:hypothetical protein